MFVPFVLVLILLSSKTLLASSSNDIPTLKLSNISEKNITEQVNFFSLTGSEEQLPQDKSSLQSLLSMLQTHIKTNTFGDKYLAVFELHNDTQQADWFVYPYGSAVQHIEILCYECSNFNEPVISGHGLNNQQDFHYGSKILLAPEQSATVAMLFSSDYFYSPIKIVVTPFGQAKKQFNLENVLLLLGLGVSLALGIYNLFIFTGIRNYQYMTYAFSTMGFAIGWAGTFGVPAYLGLSNSLVWVIPVFLIATIFTCFFNIQFLRLDKRDPKVALALKALSFACLVSIPFALYNQGLGIYLVSIGTSIAAMIGIYTGVRSWVDGYSPAKYFTLALLCVVLPNIIGNLSNLGILPSYNANLYLMGLIGNCLDSLMLAFALAAQLRVLSLKNIELNTTLEKVVTSRTNELQTANAQLEQTNSELIDANNAKTRFLAAMSHEIRTPLTSIIGYADGILTGDIDRSEQERVTKIICENGNHLLRVINDILDISKIDANKLGFESIPTHLFSVLAQVESLIGKRARDKGLAFHLDYQYPLPAQIITDPTRLKQILFNLTNNAIKFTTKGYVGLSVALDDNMLVICVKDSGVGISVEQQKQLFQPFTQADNSINRRFGGTGLGLSISQRLAQGLGGSIEVNSKPNEGSIFVLKIKVDLLDNTQWINSVTEIWESTPSKTIQPVTLPNFAGSKVLLAEDHPNNRELITLFLKRMNIQVVQVENGKEVLEILFRHSFDLLLLDIHMPIMDGSEALQTLRAAGNSTPAIALTANNMQYEIDEYLKAGFSEHLPKPLDRELFVSKLSKFLTAQGEMEQAFTGEGMLALVKEYQVSLREQLFKIEQALLQRDLPLISEISHIIKGSAGSFGFALIGRKFANIEYSALQDDEISIAYELPKVIALSRQCIDLPGVNIPQGIINHKNNVELFLEALYGFLAGAEVTVLLLKDSIDNLETNSALVYLYKLLPSVQACGLTDSELAIRALEPLIAAANTADCKLHLEVIETQLAELNRVTQPALLSRV
ncbi:ATP-binding protein [Paraglaciecola sp. 2405UD69-4]|uniref:ATP-binding protein n=1 Tax=Paraglaciecola sp. 2405UD69-4 TaxID=3391836 RepID=UPI0039C9D69F